MTDHVTPESSAETTGLELPVDFSRAPGAPGRWESQAFELGTAEDVQVTAAFGILLFRYNGQATIPLWVSAQGAGPTPDWTILLELDTDPLRTAADLLRQTGDQVARRLPPPASLGQTGNTAAVSWVSTASGGGALADIAGSQAVLGRQADLHLVLGPPAARREAMLVYNATLFKRSSIA